MRHSTNKILLLLLLMKKHLSLAILCGMLSLNLHNAFGFTTMTDIVRPSCIPQQQRQAPTPQSMVGDARGDYYGESGGSFMVREFALYDQLKEIVDLASKPLPERPDGIVCVAKYSSQTRDNCRATEAEYERLARNNPATLFLRCFEEYQDAHILFGQANVQVFPTYDIFYQNNRVARVEGPSLPELEELVQSYQFQNSNLDLFSEDSPSRWGDGQRKDATKTPRTTNAFIPGYDWNKDKGFFDDLGDKFQEDFDKIYGSWVPQIDDDDEPKK